MHRSRTLLLSSLMLPLVAGSAMAASPAADPDPVFLYRGVAPGSEGKTGPETPVPGTDGLRRVAGIHKPSLIPYLPKKDSATGTGVIILPGGGHKYLAIDNEGHSVARWLSERGIAAFVLKYRLAREEGSTYKVEEHAWQDTQRALRLVRSRAKDWQLDPARVGLIGFSAGGQLTALASLRFDPGNPQAKDPVERESSRPAFQALLYGGGPNEQLPVPKDAPPAFICVASDDKGPTKNALAVFQRLREAGIDAELHVFARGGHGFGMKEKPFAVTSWTSRFQEWMRDQGMLKAGPVSPPLSGR